MTQLTSPSAGKCQRRRRSASFVTETQTQIQAPQFTVSSPVTQGPSVDTLLRAVDSDVSASSSPRPSAAQPPTRLVKPKPIECEMRAMPPGVSASKKPFLVRYCEWERGSFDLSEVRLFQSKCEKLAIVKERFWKLEITEGVVNKKTFDLDRGEGERYTYIGEDRMNDHIKRELELHFKVPTVVINLQFALDVEAVAAKKAADEATKKAALDATKAVALATRAPPSSARRANVPIDSSQITIVGSDADI